jgi:hypothetical protein
MNLHRLFLAILDPIILYIINMLRTDFMVMAMEKSTGTGVHSRHKHKDGIPPCLMTLPFAKISLVHYRNPGPLGQDHLLFGTMQKNQPKNPNKFNHIKEKLTKASVFLRQN